MTLPVLEEFANFIPVSEETFFESPTLVLPETLLCLVLLEDFCSCSDVLLRFLGMATADVTGEKKTRISYALPAADLMAWTLGAENRQRNTPTLPIPCPS